MRYLINQHFSGSNASGNSVRFRVGAFQNIKGAVYGFEMDCTTEQFSVALVEFGVTEGAAATSSTPPSPVFTQQERFNDLRSRGIVY
ncbi:MAG: hypothetical protein KME64_37460 [Scytonematopsis contorta HA4267-MV1]|jgi:hypothetical protein|nr:hypothetical protein [Scytonematopsis contorta HA4267-MV1]